MFGFEFLLIPLMLAYTFSGPIVLIVVFILVGKVKKLSHKIESLEADLDISKSTLPLSKTEPRIEAIEPVDLPMEPKPAISVSIPASTEHGTSRPEPVAHSTVTSPLPVKPDYRLRKPAKSQKSEVSIEQKIGTQWVLIAGIITVLVGVGFFLKYAYDNFGLTPLVRVIIVAVGGLACLITGEITRRRNYEVVAKGVTALGFALLYASVFAAYQLFHMIGMLPAFMCAVGITIAAMLYAVVLDEILIAFISLLGGFGAAGLVVNTFVNPARLFIYIVILSIGAMVVGTYRKWRPINFLTFIGSYVIYGLWFDKAYAPLDIEGAAVLWLGTFFAIYLIMPIIYEIVRKTKTNIEDVLLVSFNAIVTFVILLVIYEIDPRNRIALGSVILAISHFAMTVVVLIRNRHDAPLRIALIALGTAFSTLAIPLYLETHWLTVAWMIEGLLLAAIGLGYRSKFVQAISIIPLLLSLIITLFLSIGNFATILVFNSMFGLWMLMSAALLIYHLMFRLSGRLEGNAEKVVSELTFILFGAVFFFAVISEWYYYTDWNFVGQDSIRLHFSLGMIVIALVQMFVFSVKPISPGRNSCGLITLMAALTMTIFSIMALAYYPQDFWLFANMNFAFAFLAVAGLLIVSWLIKTLSNYYEKDSLLKQLPSGLVLWAVILLLVHITQHLWMYFACMVIAGGTIAHMWISIVWAIYGSILIIIGFSVGWKSLRYIALGLFTIMLVKVFVIDTKNIGSLYRITAFFATGATLVAMSYLYQHLKKKGFFEKLSTADQHAE